MKNVAISWFMNHESQAYGQLDLGVASEQRGSYWQKGKPHCVTLSEIGITMCEEIIFSLMTSLSSLNLCAVHWITL
jgi:hypothetical protein